MASTNKTGLLGLNQWTETDPVLRTDFNYDNQKIDTAFARYALKRLNNAVLKTTQTTVSISLMDYDLREYATIELYFYPKTAACAVTGGAMTSLTLNARTTPQPLARMSSTGSRGLHVTLHLMTSAIAGRYAVTGDAEGATEGAFAVTGISPENTASLELLCGDDVGYVAGTEYAVYGLHK